MLRSWTSFSSWAFYRLTGFTHFSNLFFAFGLMGIILSSITLFQLETRYSNLFYFPHSTLFIFSITLVVIGSCLWYKKFTSQLQSLNPGLRINSIENTFVVNDADAKYSFNKHIICQAEFSGIKNYNNRFIWTGDSENIEILSPEGEKLEFVKLDTLDGPLPFQPYQIVFNKPLPRGGQKEIEFSFRFFSEKKKPRNHLYQSVWSHMRKLTLEVNFESSFKFKRYSREIYWLGPAAVRVFRETIILNDDENRKIDWVIARPRVGFRYQIVWGDGTV